MKSLHLLLISGLISLVMLPTASCTQTEPEQKNEAKLTLCQDPRPEICTMDYNPVLGIDKNGEKSKFSNGCSACSNSSIIGYYPFSETEQP